MVFRGSWIMRCIAVAALAAGVATGISSVSSAAGAGLSGAPVKIGVISSDSGATGVTNDVPTLTKRWQAYINAHGGIAGHPVQVIEMNDNDDAATALQQATQLIDNDHVIAIGDASKTDTAFAKVADQAKVPVIGLTIGGGSLEYVQDPNFFSPIATLQATAWAQPGLAARAGAKKYGFAYCAEEAACAESIPIEKADATGAGISMVWSGSFSSSAPNYTAQCLAAQAAGAQAIDVAGSDQAAVERFYDDCYQQGYHVIAIQSTNIANEEPTDPQIPVTWDMSGTVPYFVKNAATKGFHTAMDSYLPRAVSPALVMMGWVGLQLFATAASNVGKTPTAQAVYKGLYALHHSTLNGLAVPLTYTKGKPHLVSCFFVVKYDHGKKILPQGLTPLCTKGALNF